MPTPLLLPRARVVEAHGSRQFFASPLSRGTRVHRVHDRPNRFRCNSRLRYKPVAYAPNRLYVSRIGRISLKLLSKPKNEVVHSATLN